jgi:hypothetical protein
MTSRVSLLSSTAIAAAAIVFAGAPSSAASLDALEKRVKALEKSGAGKSVSRAKSTMKFKISGQINRAIQHADNGVNSEIRSVTNTNSENKLRFSGTGKLTDDLKIQAYAELGNGDSASSAQAITTTDQSNGPGFSKTRYMELRITSKSMGKLYLGHGGDATDGIIGAGNLSGTGVVMSGGADEDLSFGAEGFVTSTGGAVQRVDQSNDEYDGTRQDRIRYDTPSFGGFQVTASHANDDKMDIGLRYGGNFNGVKVKAGVGYGKNEANAQRNVTKASIGFLLPMGLNFQVAMGERDLDTAGRSDPTMMYYRVGYRSGATRVALSLHDADDFSNDGDEFTAISLGVVQVIEPLGAELYAGYSNLELTKTATTNIEDINIVTVGLRVNF